jgi:peptidoglycan-N-acetylglucosamine deacetylase
MKLTVLLLLTAATLASGRQSDATTRQDPNRQLPYAPPSLLLKEPPFLAPVSSAVVNHGPRDKKLIALTFDACSTRNPSHYDTAVTRVLLDTKTPATLFLGGKWMEEETEQTRSLARIPFLELANHTFLHPHLPAVSDDRIRQELSWTQKVLYSLTGKQSTFFRPPYGDVDERVARIAAAMGLRTIQFDLASGAPDSSISKRRLIDYVSSMAKNGSIIVMHINRRGWHTAEALPEIISRLRKRGFTFVTVGDLLAAQESSPQKK